ncbi:hypothetical protein ACFL5V_00735 [Fibrobacterota bacterium]
MRILLLLILMTVLFPDVFAGTHSAWSSMMGWDGVTLVKHEAPVASGNAGGFSVLNHSVRGEEAVLFVLEGELSKGLKAGLKIYSPAGRLIKAFDASHWGGSGVVSWDRKDTGGRPLGPGLYLVRLAVENQSFEKKFMLLR